MLVGVVVAGVRWGSWVLFDVVVVVRFSVLVGVVGSWWVLLRTVSH